MNKKHQIINYNVKIDGKNFFDQPVKNDLRTYDKTQKTVTGQKDDYTTSCLLDYPYFKEHYQLIAFFRFKYLIDLSKQQAFDANPKALQQINFTGSCSGFFIRNSKSFVNLFCFNII